MDRGPDRPEPQLPRPAEHDHWRDRIAIWRDQLLDHPLFGRQPALPTQHQQAPLPQSRPRGLRYALGALIAVTLVAGLWATTRAPGPSPRVDPALPTVDPSTTTGASPTAVPPVVVHVAGAVVDPGLVELRSGARVADALTAAGGPTAAADMNRVNLALLVKDQDRVFVPVAGQPIPASPEPLTADDGPLGPINVNTASTSELEDLPGVGPAIAGAIIQHRATHGPFTTIAGLESVPGIGPSKLARLRELVTVGS